MRRTGEEEGGLHPARGRGERPSMMLAGMETVRKKLLGSREVGMRISRHASQGSIAEAV